MTPRRCLGCLCAATICAGSASVFAQLGHAIDAATYALLAVIIVYLTLTAPAYDDGAIE